MKPLFTLTDAAAQRVTALLTKKPDAAAIRIGVRARGCSGLSYTFDYADAPKKFEDVIEQHGATVFIDPAASMFLIGSQLDFVDNGLDAKFIISNPNEQGRCGCGESFHVDAEKAQHIAKQDGDDDGCP